jgi:hypothetical protein
MVDPEEAVIVNALVRESLVSAQEVLGENGLNTVLHSVGPELFAGNFPTNDTNPAIKTIEYAKLNEAIETSIGIAGKKYCAASVRHPFCMAYVSRAPRWVCQLRHANLCLKKGILGLS